MKLSFEGEDLTAITLQVIAYLKGQQALLAAEAPVVSRDTTPEPEAEEPVEEEKPKTSRRRRGNGEDKEEPKVKAKKKKAAPKKSSAKPSSRRKGNGPAAAATSVGENVGDEITDQDVSKAASAAAQVITPKGVKDVLKEFGVAGVQELDQGQRREFIDNLNGKIEAEDIPF